MEANIFHLTALAELLVHSDVYLPNGPLLYLVIEPMVRRIWAKDCIANKVIHH